MSKELVVSATRHETRIAILEDDSVVEIFYQREKEYSLAGSIHKGKVTRVLPGMQSAFVDIGLERDAFLYVSDFFEDNEEYDKVVTSVEDKVLKMEKRPERAPLERAAEITAPSEETEEEAEAVAEAAAEENGSAAIEAAAPEVSDAGPSEVKAVETRQQEVRPDRESRGDGRDRNGRGGRGRGRRGRRRRGGPGSGIPESKFYSPRRGEAETDVQTVEPEESAGKEEDFPVLPGESLAKYASPETHEETGYEPAEVAAPAPEPPPLPEGVATVAEAPVEEPVVEQAPAPPEIPVEPATTVAEAVTQIHAEAEPAAEPPAMPEAPPEPEAVAPTEAADETPETATVAAESAPELSAGELAEAELAPHTPMIEEAVAEESPAGETAAGESAAGEPASEEPIPEEDQGPEPARIPTSLTAALREQGNRFPHRLSRRARRKLRGSGYQGEHRNAGAGAAAPQTAEGGAEGDQATAEAGDSALAVAAPEPRPQRGRPERERSDRPERPARAERIERDRGERSERSSPSISELLREGQEIIVQIAKEPLGQKGARITSHIALPGRFLVYMPTVDHVGVSRKIPSDEERQRLKRILQTNRAGMTGGFIVRTAGEGKSEEELRADMHFLYNLWLDIRQKAEKRPAPLLLHHDLDLVQRILRDQLTSSFKTIWVDNEEVFEGVLRFVQRFQPALVNRVKLYTRSNPVFDEFNVTAELEKALRPKVWLKSGGYIVINQTEALVAIDVNTGKYVGKSNRLEDTIVRVNTDAIKEIVRQIRLRDLGGIIVVDFIDMDERKNRQKVMQALEEAMRADRAPYKILAFNDFGLVAITRKRVKQSLERTLCSPCPSCEGAGYIKSVQTVVGEILQEAQKMAKMIEGDDVLLRVNPEVAKVLKSNRNDYLQELEEIVGRTVMVKSDPTLHQTKFDLA